MLQIFMGIHEKIYVSISTLIICCFGIWKLVKKWCHNVFNIVSFLQNIQNIHPIVCLWLKINVWFMLNLCACHAIGDSALGFGIVLMIDIFHTYIGTSSNQSFYSSADWHKYDLVFPHVHQPISPSVFPYITFEVSAHLCPNWWLVWLQTW